MVFDLQRRRTDLSITKQIQDQATLEIRNPNRLRQALANQPLHRLPRLLDRSIAQLDFAISVVPARRVRDRGIDVFQRDGEVHDVQVEVVDAPVRELLLANRLDSFLVVERVPEESHN